MTRKFKASQVKAAIKGSGGITSTIAKKLGCDWATATTYIQKWESTQTAFTNEQETVLDLCEGVLIKSIKDGDTADAKWMLARLRKDKYAPRQEITGADGDDLTINVTVK